MTTMQADAVLTAITIENRNLGFYRAVTPRVSNIETRRIFELLAKDESEHLKSLCSLYKGSENELVDCLNRNNIDADPYYRSLIEMIDGDSSGFEALRIALNEEHASIEWFAALVDILRTPPVRDVFAQILDETRKHGDLIKEEYIRLMNMVGRADQPETQFNGLARQ